MDCGLVVFDQSSDYHDLLHEAGEHAVGANADLVVLRLLTGPEYEADTEVLDSIGEIENVNYDSRAVLDAAVASLEETVHEVLPAEIAIDTIAKAAEEENIASAVVETARNHHCDHVYLLGRQRSPTGKALFGDIAQRVVLNFDGYVTLKTD